MAWRATPNSQQYVHALNAVPVEFHKVRPVMAAWSDLLMHLNSDSQINPDAWLRTRMTRFISLLKAMGTALHYEFRDAEIQDHAYLPQWQIAQMNEQELVRKGLLDLVSGKTSLPMKVTEFPADEEMARRTADLQRLLIEWLEGDRTPVVTAQPAAQPAPPTP
ncbi:MAG: hypothetical protein EPN73_15050 [Paraburkholderia sp.]|nr:DUF6680 family protein [Paraburkholderia sp.]TAL95075.1 MAG: hypothetical protein EPN73_15050 [Paraburkholderia sp.]